MDKKEIIPCDLNLEIKEKIEDYIAEVKDKAHTIGNHGLSKEEFWRSGIFKSAIESIRGSQSASMEEKRSFINAILTYLKEKNAIKDFAGTGSKDRHDYEVRLHTNELIVIEAKGCMDGNNTTIYKRPPNANEFYIWSLCQNPGANPKKNAWSGIHTRLSAEIIDRKEVVDGVIIWDMLCGSPGRPCPKSNRSKIGGFNLPPPCVYLFPQTVSNARSNPKPSFRPKEKSSFLNCLQENLGVLDEEINFVTFETEIKDSKIFRKTIIQRNGKELESKFQEIKRTN